MESIQQQRQVYIQCANSRSFTWFHFDMSTINRNWPSIGQKFILFHLRDLNVDKEFIKPVSELPNNPCLFFSVVSSFFKSESDYKCSWAYIKATNCISILVHLKCVVQAIQDNVQSRSLNWTRSESRNPQSWEGCRFLEKSPAIMEVAAEFIKSHG